MPAHEAHCVRFVREGAHTGSMAHGTTQVRVRVASGSGETRGTNKHP